MNHYGACVSYTTAWKYLKQLTQEARYLEAVREGHWQWVYDNLNYLLSIRHEREGSYMYLVLSYRLHEANARQCFSNLEANINCQNFKPQGATSCKGGKANFYIILWVGKGMILNKPCKVSSRMTSVYTYVHMYQINNLQITTPTC